MKGKKKVSDFLTDIKVPNRLKNETYILTNNNNIIWICGYRLDDRFKCVDNSNEFVKLLIKR